jgi:phosphatidylserine/phosphatidylglycerophosphate/cardiolipin synthase-like enzyme
MRKKEKRGPLSVHAIAGAYVVLLGIDMDEESSKGVLGFAIERTDHTNNDRRDWLQGFKTFENSGVQRGTLVSTKEHPIQAFMWADFTTRRAHEYTYRIVAMRGKPGKLKPGEWVKVRIAMEDEAKGKHAVYFNRGVAGSQAYVRKFGNLPPDKVPGREAWRWLSRGLFRAMLRFIGQAKGEQYGLRAAVYEFNQGAVLKQFSKASLSGADVKIIFDARENKPNTPNKSNREAIEAAGIDAITIPRTADPNAISHNKFVVLLKDGEPIQVMTGSTNMTQGGIFGHSNVLHIVRDPEVAAKYLCYWEKLATNPAMNRKRDLDQIRPFCEDTFPVPEGLPLEKTTTTIFSPRTSIRALEWYAERMDQARTAVFLTAAFGVNDLFEGVFAKDKDYLRYLLLEKADTHMEQLQVDKDVRIAIGDILRENEFENWMERERLTGLNKNVKFIHTKYMLIDPLGDDPIVITGSANFSDASTRRNDENMLIIRGDSRVADIYLGEFMRLFNHFYFRNVANNIPTNGRKRSSGHLTPDDSWRKPYYREGSVKQKERVYFAA